LEQVDAKACLVGEEVTLMSWGNVIVEQVTIDPDTGIVLSMTARMNLDGDFKRTEKKLTWLSADPSPLVSVRLLDYDYLITKKKLEETDSFEDCLTPTTEFVVEAVGEASMASLAKGDIVQLERKGFYIVDSATSNGTTASIALIYIPDGTSKSHASKHNGN
jgi:glutamyl-tRNA synthetase